MLRIILIPALFFAAFTANAQLMVTADDTLACPNQQVLIVASGMDEYTWSPQTNLTIISSDSATFSASNGNHTYTIVGVDTASNDTDTVSITIHVGSFPIVTITSSAASSNHFVCLGSSATLTAVSSSTIDSYHWEPSATLNVDDQNVVIATPTAATLYAVTVTDNYGCTGTQSRQVNVNVSNPSANLTAVPDTICPGQSSSLTADGNGLIFAWTPTASLNVSNAKTVIASPTSSTNYTVTVTTNGCSTVANILVTVLTAPTLSYSQQSGGNSICLDETDVITVTCAECVSYAWKLPNSVLQTTSPVQTVSPNNAGAIPVVITGYSVNGCGSSLTATVNVDSCFIGNPFGIGDAVRNDLRIVQTGNSVQVSSEHAIEGFTVYNLLGEKIFELSDTQKNSASWNASAVPSGMYIVVARSAHEEVSKKVYVQKP